MTPFPIHSSDRVPVVIARPSAALNLQTIPSPVLGVGGQGASGVGQLQPVGQVAIVGKGNRATRRRAKPFVIGRTHDD